MSRAGRPRRTSPVLAADTDASTVGLLEGDTETDTDRPWSVIVWNDPINLMSYVTLIIQKVFGYSREKATSLMLDVHHKGRAVVSSGDRTESERYVHQLHGHGLWATMEHDE